MKLFITIITIILLSACSQFQLSKKNIISHIESHELPNYLEVHSLKYKSFESGSGNERVAVSGLLNLKERLYQESKQSPFPRDYIDGIDLAERFPTQSEFSYTIYSRVLNIELDNKTVLDQKYEAGLKLSFSGDLAINENVDGYFFYKDPSSNLSYQPLSARVKEDFNDPVVDINDFVDSTLLSLNTNKINCAGRSERESVQRVLSLLKKSIVTETDIMKKSFVTESSVPDLLIDVVQVGLQKGLSFEKIVPGKKPTELEKIKSREISIRAEGKLDEITAFLADIGYLPGALGIANLTISKTNTLAYSLDLILYARFNDLSVTNTDIGLVPFSKCVELLEESYENMNSVVEQQKEAADNSRLFNRFNELLTDLSGRIELDSLSGNLRNPQALFLTGKHYGAGNIKYITDKVEGFPLKDHSIKAIGDQKEGTNDFSIDIRLNKKITGVRDGQANQAL